MSRGDPGGNNSLRTASFTDSRALAACCEDGTPVTSVTDGGANSEAKRNLIGWADNSQTNAEVTRKFSHEKV
ncbi:hypothetical protein T01_8853 [Trichinella spiralis]|uniref:Uncharacterized protein n=1 Tax=Trichinella spiralis TaxID=6334 RepID=A0A0V1BPD9_TRISP|nr:hypothetical protein T01_8853 [Trichinella spiralis]